MFKHLISWCVKQFFSLSHLLCLGSGIQFLRPHLTIYKIPLNGFSPLILKVAFKTDAFVQFQFLKHFLPFFSILQRHQ